MRKIKITYLKLINFASIYTAMNKKKLELDLSKSKNRIIILVGANGSGKTSILSTLHPFATNGSLDDRDDGSLILENNDGYKEIHILDKGVMYKIKHHYLWSKKNKSTKSYIEKDGVELNPNGNVTSFKEVIRDEFFLDMDFLKLIRLGNNVTNFINMKSFERKQFTSNILSELDLFAELYKKVSKNATYISASLSRATDKLRQLNIVDIDNSILELSKMEKQRKKLSKELESIKSKYWASKGELNTLDSISLKTTYMESREREEEITERLSIYKDIEGIKEKSLIKSIESFSKSVHILEGEINSILLNIELLHKDKDRLVSSYNLYGSDRNIKSIREELNQSKEELQTLNEKYLIVDDIPYTKKDILEIMSIAQSLKDRISELLSVPDEAIKLSIELFESNQSIEKYVYGRIASLELLELEIPNKKKSSILERPKGCKYDDCPLFLAITGTTLNKKEKKSRDFYESMIIVNSVFQYVKTILEINKGLFSKTPIENFTIRNITSSILRKELFYSEEELLKYIIITEELERIIYLTDKVRSLEHEYSLISKNSESIKKIKDSIVENDKNIISLKVLKSLKEEELDNNSSELLSLKETLRKLEDKKLLSDELKTLIYNIRDMDSTISKIKSLDEKMEVYYSHINSITIELETLDKQIESLSYRTREYTNLSNEIESLSIDDKRVSLIRRSLSSNTGIPLIFIKVYLSNSKLLVNNLLKTVYNGSLEILDYIVDKEFRIPYVKNGITIHDVIRASEGEKSFISIALSFALLSESIKKYNIMLLDEIDAPLDSTNRPLFIKILEKQLDMIGSEQVFMITHNNMFDSYPVDIIRTSNVSLENYQDVNIIY